MRSWHSTRKRKSGELVKDWLWLATLLMCTAPSSSMSSLRCAYSFLQWRSTELIIDRIMRVGFWPIYVHLNSRRSFFLVWTWCELKKFSLNLNRSLFPPFFYHDLSILLYQHGQPSLALLYSGGLCHEFSSYYIESVYIFTHSRKGFSCCHQYFAIDKAIGYNKCVDISHQKYWRKEC